MLFSIIISFRQTNSMYRLKNLLTILTFLERNDQDLFEIILVEQDTSSKVTFSLPDNCKHIFCYNDGPFNKSKAYNIGASISSSEVLFFLDADIIIEFNDLIYCVGLCHNKYDAVDPKGKVLALFIDEYNIFKPTKYHFRESMNFGTCAFLIKKSKFNLIGGWDEYFLGWGAEDDAMAYKIETMLFSITRMDYELYHLYHDESKIDKNNYQKNLDRLHIIKSMGTDELYNFYNDIEMSSFNRLYDKEK